jgi:hypothetical protein
VEKGSRAVALAFPLDDDDVGRESMLGRSSDGARTAAAH